MRLLIDDANAGIRLVPTRSEDEQIIASIVALYVDGGSFAIAAKDCRAVHGTMMPANSVEGAVTGIINDYVELIRLK